jgi:hypothetical protein
MNNGSFSVKTLEIDAPLVFWFRARSKRKFVTLSSATGGGVPR